MNFKYENDNIIITDGNTKTVLDWTEFDELLTLVFDGLCHICNESINRGASLCCDCFNDEAQWHKKHCETSGAH